MLRDEIISALTKSMWMALLTWLSMLLTVLVSMLLTLLMGSLMSDGHPDAKHTLALWLHVRPHCTEQASCMMKKLSGLAPQHPLFQQVSICLGKLSKC